MNGLAPNQKKKLAGFSSPKERKYLMQIREKVGFLFSILPSQQQRSRAFHNPPKSQFKYIHYYMHTSVHVVTNISSQLQSRSEFSLTQLQITNLASGKLIPFYPSSVYRQLCGPTRMEASSYNFQAHYCFAACSTTSISSTLPLAPLNFSLVPCLQFCKDTSASPSPLCRGGPALH